MMEKLREALERLWPEVEIQRLSADPDEPDGWRQFVADLVIATEAARRVLDAPRIDWCMTHSGVPRWCPADVEHVVVPARLITEETE